MRSSIFRTISGSSYLRSHGAVRGGAGPIGVYTRRFDGAPAPGPASAVCGPHGARVGAVHSPTDGGVPCGASVAPAPSPHPPRQLNPLIGEGTCALSGDKSAQKTQLKNKAQGRLSLLRGTVTRGEGVMRILLTQVHTMPRI